MAFELSALSLCYCFFFSSAALELLHCRHTISCCLGVISAVIGTGPWSEARNLFIVFFYTKKLNGTGKYKCCVELELCLKYLANLALVNCSGYGLWGVCARVRALENISEILVHIYTLGKIIARPYCREAKLSRGHIFAGPNLRRPNLRASRLVRKIGPIIELNFYSSDLWISEPSQCFFFFFFLRSNNKQTFE